MQPTDRSTGITKEVILADFERVATNAIVTTRDMLRPRKLIDVSSVRNYDADQAKGVSQPRGVANMIGLICI